MADRGHPSVLYLYTLWALKATRPPACQVPGFLGNGESLRQSNPANHTACHQAQPWPPPKYSNSDTTLDQYNIKTIHIRNWKLNLILSNHTACHRPQPRPPSSSDRQLAGDRWPAERREGRLKGAAWPPSSVGSLSDSQAELGKKKYNKVWKFCFTNCPGYGSFFCN